MKKTNLILVVGVALLLFTGCADVSQVQECVQPENTYGFWSGLWHGIIAPFSFIGSLIWDDVAMYGVNNNGGWYDFGFVLGAGILLGGSGSQTKR